MGLIVQKYGGSSVADAEGMKRVAARIVASKRDGNQVVVAVILAALGAAGGLWAWLHVVQICESNGLSKSPRFAVPEHRRVLNEGEDA